MNKKKFSQWGSVLSTEDKGKTLIPKSGPFYEWGQGLCLLKANKAVSMNVYMSVQGRKAFLRVHLVEGICPNLGSPP